MKERVRLGFSKGEHLDDWGGWLGSTEEISEEIWAVIQPYVRNDAAIGWRIKRGAPDHVKALEPISRRWWQVYKVLLRCDRRWQYATSVVWKNKHLKVLTEPAHLPEEPDEYVSFLVMEISQDRLDKKETQNHDNG